MAQTLETLCVKISTLRIQLHRPANIILILLSQFVRFFQTFIFRGAGTMMAFYKAAEKFGLECMQLTPAFDIDLFAEPDNEEYNIIGDEMENPFFQTPAGQQTLVSCYLR